MSDLHASTELLIQFAYQHLKPDHFRVEDYCNTLLFRLASGERCFSSVMDTLERSPILGAGEVQIRLVKESESLLFHLAGAFEASGQLMNAILQLGMPEASGRHNGRFVQGVSFKKASAELTANYQSLPVTSAINDAVFKSFVSKLFDARDQVTHRKLLDYHAVVGNTAWQPYVNINGSSFPLVPYLREMLSATNLHIESALAATISSFPTP